MGSITACSSRPRERWTLLRTVSALRWSERPRKNLACLLRAFASLKDRGPQFASLRLLKVGSAGRSDGYRTATLEEARRLGIDNDIDFVDHVPDQDLAVIYSNALALVYPSLYEGFGLPVVEARPVAAPLSPVIFRPCPKWLGPRRCWSIPRILLGSRKHCTA